MNNYLSKRARFAIAVIYPLLISCIAYLDIIASAATGGFISYMFIVGLAIDKSMDKVTNLPTPIGLPLVITGAIACIIPAAIVTFINIDLTIEIIHSQNFVRAGISFVVLVIMLYWFTGKVQKSNE